MLVMFMACGGGWGLETGIGDWRGRGEEEGVGFGFGWDLVVE